jgi:2-polyprenyl-3-methyl-5-hydroxy-6-metoxy-1,4-benzoquinol methylase
MTRDYADIEKKITHCYSSWGASYYEDYYGENSAYPPIHVDIVKALLVNHKPRTLLDAGCGPASFMRFFANSGIELYGFDLTKEMVTEAQNVMASFEIDPGRIWQGSVVRKTDYTRPQFPKLYDAVLCSGVLPHIPESDEVTVLQNLYDSVDLGGLIIVEARDALFSLFTLNRYSYEFIYNDLIQFEKLLSKAEGNSDALRDKLRDFKNYFRMDLPKVRTGKHGDPGYDEVLSRTHNPLTLASDMQRLGLKGANTFLSFSRSPTVVDRRSRGICKKKKRRNGTSDGLERAFYGIRIFRGRAKNITIKCTVRG